MTPAPEATAAWQVILTLGVLFAIGANVMVILRQNRIQKREVSFGFEPASKEECLERHQDNGKNIASLRADLERMRSQRADDVRDAAISRKSIYDKIDVVAREQREHTEHVRRELSDKLDNMPERVITTLRNTGAI